jgi:putative sigma-54 modulation protein
MQVIIQSPHFKAGKELTNHVNEKVNKLSRFYMGIIAAEVCLKLDGAHPAKNKVCEIRLIIPGNDLFALSQCETFEEAINETVDALKEQIRKHKYNVQAEDNDLQVNDLHINE